MFVNKNRQHFVDDQINKCFSKIHIIFFGNKIKNLKLIKKNKIN
jgi:hypothetical protein